MLVSLRKNVHPADVHGKQSSEVRHGRNSARLRRLTSPSSSGNGHATASGFMPHSVCRSPALEMTVAPVTAVKHMVETGLIA